MWWRLIIKIKQFLGKVIRVLYRMVYRFIPVDPHLMVFISFHGRGYLDNPRAIYEACLEDPDFKDFRFVWMIKHHRQQNLDIPGAKIVEYFSLPYFYYMSKAKYWIVNCKLPLYMRKKKQQFYLQTWHGVPFKHLGHDIQVDENTTFYRSQLSYEKMCETYDVDAARYDAMISPNPYCDEIFPRAFHVSQEKLWKIGYPRNDSLQTITPLEKSKKVILYAPTWRDDSYVYEGYTFHLEADFHLWKEKLGSEYVVLFKPHYLIINEYENDPALEGFLYPVKADADIADLYPYADLLITDYSSVFFDYAILNRPIYFYMYDLTKYDEEMRGFYLDLNKDLPGKVYTKEEDLLAGVKRQDFDYQKLAKFNERFNQRQNGHCARDVLDRLKERGL